MKRFLPDTVFIVLAAAAAFLMAGAPPQEVKRTPPAPSQAEGAAQAMQVAPVSPAVTAQPVPAGAPLQDGDAAGKRNLFSATGRYSEDPAAAAVIPEKPYELIGIVRDGQTAALFREYSGNTVRVKQGYKMLDGFLIETIDGRKVTARRGEEKKEFRVLDPDVAAFGSKENAGKSSHRNPVLIGILGGAVRKAVFRDQTGALMVLEARQSLPDGSVLTRIDPGSVTVRKEGRTTELKPQITAMPLSPFLQPAKITAAEGTRKDPAGPGLKASAENDGTAPQRVSRPPMRRPALQRPVRPATERKPAQSPPDSTTERP